MAKRGSSGGFACGKVAGKRAKAAATLEKGTPPKDFAKKFKHDTHGTSVLAALSNGGDASNGVSGCA